MPPHKERDTAGQSMTAEVAALAAELAEPEPELELEPEPEPEPEPPLTSPLAAEPASAPELSVASDDARAELRRLGAARTRLVAKLEGVETELFAAIRVADDVDVPKLTIAKDAGVSRQTVYNVLAR